MMENKALKVKSKDMEIKEKTQLVNLQADQKV